MDAMNPPDWSITRAAQELRKRSLSCVEYCQAFVARQDQRAALNAFIHRDAEQLLADAAALDARGTPAGALYSIPLAIKDNINVAGMPTTAGTGALARFVPTADAAVMARLRAAGALVVGKANMHELAFGCTSNNATTGAVRNPRDETRIPGGSSGGTAAAVGGGLVPAGIGTDTGASVRQPAALCGVVGFRPTVGRYPTRGIVPISHTRDTPGPMAHCVDDILLLDEVMAGGAEPAETLALSGIRLGVPRSWFLEQLEPQVADVAQRSMTALREAGATMVEVDVDDIVRLNAKVGMPIALYEFVQELPRFLAAQGLALSLQDMLDGVHSPDVHAILASQLGAQAVTEAAYRQALDVDRPRLQAAYAECFHAQRIDALLFPTSGVTAPRIGDDETFELNGRRVPTFPTLIRNTDPGSNAAIPGISLPAGDAANGLPVGMELDGPQGSDRHLLAVARSIERVLRG
ncbi:MAG TPA: indoleacetamide hydrolase [Nevskiaceae bacterium]